MCEMQSFMDLLSSSSSSAEESSSSNLNAVDDVRLPTVTPLSADVSINVVLPSFLTQRRSSMANPAKVLAADNVTVSSSQSLPSDYGLPTVSELSGNISTAYDGIKLDLTSYLTQLNSVVKSSDNLTAVFPEHLPVDAEIEEESGRVRNATVTVCDKYWTENTLPQSCSEVLANCATNSEDAEDDGLEKTEERFVVVNATVTQCDAADNPAAEHLPNEVIAIITTATSSVATSALIADSTAAGTVHDVVQSTAASSSDDDDDDDAECLLTAASAVIVTEAGESEAASYHSTCNCAPECHVQLSHDHDRFVTSILLLLLLLLLGAFNNRCKWSSGRVLGSYLPNCSLILTAGSLQ